MNKNKEKIAGYKEVFTYFLGLGFFGFGGPLALVGNIQKDLVEKRQWIEEEDFNVIFSLIKAMPGPVSFQIAIFMGRHRAGFFGAVLAAIGVTAPAFFLMIVFSIFYQSLSHLPTVHLILQGMQVTALGVILGSLKALVKTNMKDLFFWVLIIFSGAINLVNPSIEPLIILSFGLLIILLRKWQRESSTTLMSIAVPVAIFSSTMKDLALVCFKAGALVFGTGFAIVPMLQHDVVDKYHWLSQNEFIDALAFGQMTPGPVVITATYIGHNLAGMPGAFVATIAIFAAAFFHMTTWFPYLISRLKGKKWINDFTFGSVAAVVGPIIVAVLKMGVGIPLDIFLISLAIIAFILTFSNKVPMWLLILMGGIFNYLFRLIF